MIMGTALATGSPRPKVAEALTSLVRQQHWADTFPHYPPGRRARRDAARTSRAREPYLDLKAAEPERPIFETEARDDWARIGHGAGVINFDCTRFAGHEIRPDKCA